MNDKIIYKKNFHKDEMTSAHLLQISASISSESMVSFRHLLHFFSSDKISLAEILSHNKPVKVGIFRY